MITVHVTTSYHAWESAGFGTRTTMMTTTTKKTSTPPLYSCWRKQFGTRSFRSCDCGPRDTAVAPSGAEKPGRRRSPELQESYGRFSQHPGSDRGSGQARNISLLLRCQGKRRELVLEQTMFQDRTQAYLQTSPREPMSFLFQWTASPEIYMKQLISVFVSSFEATLTLEERKITQCSFFFFKKKRKRNSLQVCLQKHSDSARFCSPGGLTWGAAFLLFIVVVVAFIPCTAFTAGSSTPLRGQVINVQT